MESVYLLRQYISNVGEWTLKVIIVMDGKGGMLLGTERKAVFVIKWQKMWLNCVLPFFCGG